MYDMGRRKGFADACQEAPDATLAKARRGRMSERVVFTDPLAGVRDQARREGAA